MNPTISSEGIACDNAASRDVQSRDPVAVQFHRHCQATVLSANGYKTGIGKTWHILAGVENTDSIPSNFGLPSLQELVTKKYAGRSVQGYFVQNESNITEDLRSILELIDLVAARQFKLTINITDESGNLLRSVTVDADGSSSYDIPIGRWLDLKLNLFGDRDSYKFHFNTVNSSASPQTTMVTIPAHTLTFNYGGVMLDNVDDVVMKEDATIELPNDRTRIAAMDNAGYDTNGGDAIYVVKRGADVNARHGKLLVVKPDPNWHVYRVYLSGSGMYDPRGMYDLEINLEKYKNKTHTYMDPNRRIIEFELHVTNYNTIASTWVTLEDYETASGDNHPLNLTNTDAAPENYSRTRLTDRNYVDSRHTGVWVFRIDTYNRSCVWNFAYQYYTGDAISSEGMLAPRKYIIS